MKLELEGIPADLKPWRHWVVWRSQQRGGKFTKPPYCPATGQLASVRDPGTWASYPEACAALASGRYTGPAFILTASDPYCGIDLDQAVEAPGHLASWARAIVDHFASYTEWSPSRTGLHIWIRGALPGPRRRKERVELYDALRCLTCTGWHLEGTPRAIEARQPELEAFYQHLFPPVPHKNRQAQPQVPMNLSDAELLARATRVRNGARFARLWAGETADYSEDHSRADLALCGLLAFWAGGDAARMDRLFRQSGLMRPKWDHPHFATGETYGQRTIAHALEQRGGVRVVAGSSSKTRP